MAPTVTLHAFAPNDLNGAVQYTLTDEDPYLRSLALKVEREGLGGAELVLSRTVGEEMFAFTPELFFRVLIHAYSDTVYYPWGFFLNKRHATVIHREEDGSEEWRLGGAGPKMYLDRAALGIGGPAAGWNVDLENGVWRWGDSATVGRILERIIAQDGNMDDPALPDLTTTFDQTNDSASVAWTETSLGSGTDPYTIPIGTSLLRSLWDLEDVLELTSWIELGTVASPKFELNVSQGFGADKTGNVFGSGVCLLKEGANIAEDALKVEGHSLRKASHVIVEGDRNKWAIAERPTFTPGDYVKYAKIEYTRSGSVYWLEKAGIRWLKRQDNGEKSLSVEIVPGQSDATGLYFPAPDRVLWLSNLISVDTSADGSTHTQLDIQPSEDQLVTGFLLETHTAADDADATALARSWDVTVYLNRERPGTIQRTPDQRSAASGAGGSCSCPLPAPLCDPGSGETLTEVYPNDDSVWGGSFPYTSPHCGPDYHNFGASGHNTLLTVSADTNYQLGLIIDANRHAYTLNIEYWNGVPGSGGTLISEEEHAFGIIGTDSGVECVIRNVSFTTPPTTTRVRLQFQGKLGGWRYQAVLNEVTAGTPGGGGEFCIEYPDGYGESPYWMPSDEVERRLELLGDAIDELGQAEELNASTPGSRLTSYPFTISAHRGDIGSADSYPENTLEAVQQAAVKGARMIEMDVQRSADGTWHLMHDTTVTRTTDGTGTLSAMTDAAIAALNIDGGYGYDAGRHGATLKVPTLEAVLTILDGHDVIANLDNKDTGGDAGATSLAEFVRDQGWLGRVAIHSYSTTALTAIKAVSSRIHTSISTNVEPDPVNNDDVDEVIERETEWTSRADADQYAPKYAASFIHPDFDYGIDETSRLEDMFSYGIRFYHTLNLDLALGVRGRLVAGDPEAGGRWEVVMTGSGASLEPVTNDAETDWLYAFVT